MNRYLMNISYVGTLFRGIQRQVKYCEQIPSDRTTIQGWLELALRGLRPINDYTIVTSSRTDAGVHALHSTVTVDLERKSGRPYTTDSITLCVNKYLEKSRIPIRVLSTFLAPDDFQCRHARSRTYLYRIIIVKTDSLHHSNLLQHIPIEEYDRALIKCTCTFDVEKMREASKEIIGYHDFKTFMGKSNNFPDKMTRREIYNLDIEEGVSNLYTKYSIPMAATNDPEDYRFVNIYITGNGFLYKQVRRTVAALIGVAQGTLTTRDIKLMLQVPSADSWHPQLKTAPAHGLYLCAVNYSKETLERLRTVW